MDELTTEAAYYRRLYEDERKLNDGLLRIARERANAQRGLTPKATHPGYIVLSSAETVSHDSLGRTYVYWRTCVQTPYAASLSPESLTGRLTAARPDILRDLQIPEGSVDHTTLRADYRSGLWEVQIYHSHPCVVPSDMIPRKH